MQFGQINHCFRSKFFDPVVSSLFGTQFIISYVCGSMKWRWVRVTKKNGQRPLFKIKVVLPSLLMASKTRTIEMPTYWYWTTTENNTVSTAIIGYSGEKNIHKNFKFRSSQIILTHLLSTCHGRLTKLCSTKIWIKWQQRNKSTPDQMLRQHIKRILNWTSDPTDKFTNGIYNSIIYRR